MATPYFQVRFDSVGSTQDIAREEPHDLPLLVVATSQTSGRGRSGTQWINADRALAASLALRRPEEDVRPFSLMAGIAAVRATGGTTLKWPNDVLIGDLKVGGILVEKSNDVVVIGLGLNLWWPVPLEGATALFEDDPGEERHAEIAGLWGAELMRLIDGDGWPEDEYRENCVTIGREISFDPDGFGMAVGIVSDGGLVVRSIDGVTKTIYSGRVRHV